MGRAGIQPSSAWARLLGLALALGARRAACFAPINVSSCAAAQYFDIDSLLCTACPTGLYPSQTGLSCECAGNTIAAPLADSYAASKLVCVACAAGLVPLRISSFGWARGETCVPCGTDAAAEQPTADFTLVTDSDGLTTVANVSITCPNTTLPDQTLGTCTALATPEARCPSTSGAECACPPGHVLAQVGGHGAPLAAKRCEPCAPNAYPSPSDARACVPCADERMVHDGSACQCPAGWNLLAHAGGLWGRDATCVLSAAQSAVTSSVDTSVASRITYTAVLPATSASGTATTATVDSATLAQLFIPAASECLTHVTTGGPALEGRGARSACQALANLCVLSDYNPAAAACAMSKSAQDRSSAAVHGESEWRAHLPWLRHKDATSALSSTDFSLNVAVSAQASGGQATVGLVLNSYSLNGTWLGLTNLSTQLQLCGGPRTARSKFLQVGTSFVNSCTLDIANDLAALAQPLGAAVGPTAALGAAHASAGGSMADANAQLRGAFHELYVLDTARRLYPVPVRVLNYAGGLNLNGAAAPAATTAVAASGTASASAPASAPAPSFALPSAVDPSVANDVLTRRFFLVDALSGRKLGAAPGAAPEVVRYASYLRLQMDVREADPTSMAVPVLTIGYSEAIVPADAAASSSSSSSSSTSSSGSTASASASASASSTAAVARPSSAVGVPASFESYFSMRLVRYWTSVSILLVVCCVLVLIGWLYACFAWVRRNQRSVVDGSFLLNALVHALRVYAEVFFWLLAGLAAHWYVFFKAQAQAFVMLPAEEEVGPLVLMLALALAGKSAHVLQLLLRQGRADIFLIDWETAHGTLLGKGGEPADDTPVSIWRTIFVANELNELQRQRMTRPSLTLLLVLGFMVGLDFERFGRAVPGDASGDTENVPSHLLLRFAVALFVWGVVLLGQVLLLRLVWLPYVEDRVGQFVDLLAVANVSALILPEPLCGFYLHGRSVHAHADCGMLELNRQLQAEEEGLTGHRGLSQVSELQTFAVHLSPRLRELYDQKFLVQALAQAQPGASAPPGRRRALGGSSGSGLPSGSGSSRVPGGLGSLGPGVSIPRARRAGDGFRASPEATVERYLEMNSLLREFIDGSLAGHEFSIREKTYAERLLGLPPDMTFFPDSLFLYDRTAAWTKSLLYGQEYNLCLLEVLVYTVTDMSLRSSYAAAAITYVVWLVVEALRGYLGQINLAKKTLIDDRFLI